MLNGSAEWFSGAHKTFCYSVFRLHSRPVRPDRIVKRDVMTSNSFAIQAIQMVISKEAASADLRPSMSGIVDHD
jgi:multisubunit Na+/H+ antiporter MnhF subunit